MRYKILTLILILILFCVFSISLAYSTLRNNYSGKGSIKGASWEVAMMGNSDNIEITSGNSEQEYIITVNNNSEVDVVYSIQLTNLPSGVKVKLDDEEYKMEDNNQITFKDVGTLLYGSNSKKHTLTFSATLDAVEITNHDFNVNVQFKQKLN